MANSINGMAERLRARLGREETIALPGCYDALSAPARYLRERKYLG